MQNNRRYWYAFAGALFFLIGSVVVSGWLWSRYQSSQTHLAPSGTPTTATSSQSTATTQPTQQRQVTPGGQAPLDMHESVKLIIPSIGINASVEVVGIDKQGHMATPQGNPWDNVGWYQAGTVPGQPGSAVIDGHLDRPGGSPAVFWNLHKLHEGDEVLVQDGKGHTLRFRVYKVETYTPDGAPVKQIFSDTSGIYLNLITCAGQWIPEQQQTSHRLVVYTKLEQ